MKDGDENKYRFLHQLSLLTTIPMILLSGPVIGFLIGDYIDRRFGTSPWFMVFFLVIGFVASIRQAITIINKASKNQ